MNAKILTLSAALVGFLSLTAAVVLQHGYLGFFELVLSNTASMLAMVDLVICLALFGIWMWGDAQEHGISAVPYLIVGLLFGAAGPLLYLIVRERKLAPVPA